MNTPAKTFAEALQEAHTDLLRGLQELERAVGADSREGPAELGSRLENALKHLMDHFRFEEQGGYMAPVLAEEPRFGPLAEELLAEHSVMASAFAALIQEVGRAQAVQDGHRERARALVSQVRHHETRENNLVQEAYYSSGGTGD
jgi:hypothetical protein